MDNEKILLDALNTFGNFTSVEQSYYYTELDLLSNYMSFYIDCLCFEVTNFTGFDSSDIISFDEWKQLFEFTKHI